ncbi:MAG: TolC family protein, partial [bacterium]
MSISHKIWVWLVVLLACNTVDAGEPNGRILTLDEAVEFALNNNAALQAARAGLAASGYRLRKSRLDLLPKADLQVSYARLDPGTVRRGNVFVDVGRELVKNFGAGDPADIRPGAYANNFATTLQVVQPIYNGGANWATVGLARAQQAGSEHVLEDTRQRVILEVKRRYLQTLQARELVALANKSLESSQHHLASSRKMLEVGLRSRTDVLRWEVQVANSEGQLVEAENNVVIALAALKQVVGMPYEQELSVSSLPFEPVPLREGLEAQIARTQAHHPGLKAALASVDAGRAGVRLAWAAFQPQVNFVYQVGWEQNNTFALDSFRFWNAGVSVKIPIFHSFSSLAQLQERKAELRRIEENRKESERLVTLELIRARSNVETANKKYHIALKTVEQARENLRVLDNTYEAGLAANIDVLDAQVVLTRAETQ